MSVYFALVGDFIKVGYSADVPKRLAHIRHDCIRKPAGFDRSRRVELLRTVIGGRTCEGIAHAALKPWRAAGEWYHSTPQCLAAIAYLTQSGDIPLVRSLRLRHRHGEDFEDQLTGWTDPGLATP